jgi:UDP-2-acetamido-2,6-beta-L-arabino-hexul-4-ose reductase
MKHDDRGWLTEFIKSSNFGQIFISRTKPGITRGNHWHHTKVEKFLVVEGDAVVRFRHVYSRKVIEYRVSGSELKVLDIPAGYTHSITNTGSCDVITIFWADELFNPERPDTNFLEVL